MHRINSLVDKPAAPLPKLDRNASRPPKLAIIGLSTFGYFERLAGHITRCGVEARFFDERPSNDVATKLTLRLLPKGLSRLLVKKQLTALCDGIIAGNHTHVLVIFAELIGPAELQRLKDNGIKVFRYTWDSVGNRPSVRKLDHLMAAIGSFDPEDCRNHGYHYIPLYSETVQSDDLSAFAERPNDFYLCGTMHSVRARRIEEQCVTHNWSILLKLFYHSRKLFVLKNLHDLTTLRMTSRISETGFKHAETLEDCRRSKVVLDINHPRQQGLTMRTFETIAQGAVLLSTNRMAVSLLDPVLQGRIVLLDDKDFAGSMQRALQANPAPLSAGLRHTLSVERFVHLLLEMLGLESSYLPTGSTAS